MSIIRKDAPDVDYKNITVLKKYITEKGKNSSKQGNSGINKKTKRNLP